MTIWFTSDLHIGHVNISEYCNRPFEYGATGVPTMNQAIIDLWNATVANDDTVYILGDLVMGKIAESLPLASTLNGHKVLIPGNHDRCWSDAGSVEKRLKGRLLYEEAGYELRSEQTVFIFNGVTDRVEACHFPFTGESDSDREDRYAEHRPTDNGQWLIHGHVHDQWRQNGRQINVGLDAWGGRLVHVDEIVDMINSGPQNLPRLPWE